MPCLHEKDLSALAQQHIEAQRANIQNQRTRLGEILYELKQLKSNPAADPLRIAEAENAVTDLEYHLNGRVKRSSLEDEAASLKKSGLKPERLKRVEETLAKSFDNILKDPDLGTAEDRAKIMEALYTQRQHFAFEDTAHDKDAAGNPIPRYASVFGAPTVKKMREAGEHEIADDLTLRSISMVMGGEATRNPNDYLDTTGIEVKKSLSDGIEHHHIYNNVYVDNNGRVAPNSVRYFRNAKTGDIEMEVIPEYWNSAKHGRNTQFIELMDGAHSGDDTATHLHYYKFNDAESSAIRAKIQSKVADINATNAARVPKLDAELKELNERKADPVAYEKKLSDEIAHHDSRIKVLDVIEVKHTNPNAKGHLVKKRGLSPTEEKELEDARSERSTLIKAHEKATKALIEHQTFMSIESDIKKWEVDVLTWESEAKKLKLSKKYPNATHPMYADKAAAKIAKAKLESDAKDLSLKIRANKKILREKGSIDQQVRDKTAKRQEAERLSKLTETEALALYDRTNGYFHFDKGHQESEDYTKSRPRMNSEIHKYNARQAIEDLEKQHGTNTIKALQDLADKHYRRNLLYNLETLVDKAAGTLK